MEGSGTPESEEREVTRVESPPHRGGAHGTGHRGVDDLPDPPCGLHGGEPELRPERRTRRVRGVEVEFEVAAGDRGIG